MPPGTAAPSPDWKKVRASFPGLADKVFLDAACISIAPAEAKSAIDEFVDMVVRAPMPDATAHHIALDEARTGARKAAAALVGASEDEIAIVESTTHGLNIVAQGLELSGSDNVVLCDLEFVGVSATWAARARETGMDLRFVRNRAGRIDLDAIAAAVDGSTRAICLSSVQWCSGQRLDLAGLSELARKRRAFLLVDSIQHLGAMPLDVGKTPVDAVVCGGHKWLNAPFGVGFLYVRRESLPALRPHVWGYLNLTPPHGGWGTYFSTPDISPMRAYEYVPTAQRLEIGGTSNYPGLRGFTASVDLINRTGHAAIEERIHGLVDRLHEAGAGAGFEILSPRERDKRSGIVILTAGKGAALDKAIVERLGAKRVCVSQRYTNRVGGIRASVHFFNDEDDIDTFVAEAAKARDRG